MSKYQTDRQTEADRQKKNKKGEKRKKRKNKQADQNTLSFVSNFNSSSDTSGGCAEQRTHTRSRYVFDRFPQAKRRRICDAQVV